MSTIADFNELQGGEFDFYGASENQFKLDDSVWEATEDESDGYRSYLGSVERKESAAIFFQTPIARVRLQQSDDIYRLVDVSDQHVWLEFGTDHSDDYYPWFTFTYHPKGPEKAGKP